MKDEIIQKLQHNGVAVASCDRLPNDTGWQIKCADGGIVNVYDKGSIVPQGKTQQKLKEILGMAGGVTKASAAQAVVSRNIFVVYGHDGGARTELAAMLGRWGLNTLILDELPSEGQTIIEKLEAARDQANFAVVLATPDDEGFRRDHPDEKSFRARQNVVLELGMMLAHLGRRRVAILMKDPGKMERPSDIQGLVYISFKEKVEEAKVQLAKEINAAGIAIDLGRL